MRFDESKLGDWLRPASRKEEGGEVLLRVREDLCVTFGVNDWRYTGSTRVSGAVPVERFEVWIYRWRPIGTLWRFEELPLGSWFEYDNRLWLCSEPGYAVGFSCQGEMVFRQSFLADMEVRRVRVWFALGHPHWSIWKLLWILLILLFVLWLSSDL